MKESMNRILEGFPADPDAAGRRSHGAGGNDDESETLQSRLETSGNAEPVAGALSITDPVALFRHLDASARFHRDTGIGRLFHPGRVSLRENVPNDSLHVVVEGNRVSAHVDRVSPLGVRPAGPSRYSAPRAVAHNLVGMAQDVVALLRGRQGDHRCELDCEWVPNDGDNSSREADVLGPEASAWSVQLEARVTGRIDEARLREALATAFGRRTFEDDPLKMVACDDDVSLDAARGQLQALAVPITAWPPLHAWVARGPAGDVLMLNLNHAAADGFGALRVLDSIARAYAGNMTPEASLEVLAGSDLPIRPAAADPSILTRSARRLIERLRDALARPSLLAVDQPEDRAGCRFHLIALSEEQTREVNDVRLADTGSNVLMAALHLEMDEWNLQHRTPGRRFHVLTTVNLRPVDWQAEPVGNFSVTARVSTTRRERRGPAAALSAVAAQTARNKAGRTGVALMAALERSGLLPMWAKQSTAVLRALTGNVLVDNALLTDVGRLDELPVFGPDAGPTVGLWVSTPARSPLTLSLGAVTIGGRLHLSFRYPNRLFGPEAARRFAEGYLRQLRLVAQSRL